MPTLFQEKVYKVCKSIPYGKVTTYKMLAAAINCKSPRAVGQALKKNPYAPDVPCHRVIASDLTVGGYQGEKSGVKLAKKRRLLKKEGIIFQNGYLLDKTKIFTPKKLKA